ncbi:MAG: ATP-binding protein [Nitrospiria bacterium]
MKCQKCRQKSILTISRSNAKYCKLCFIENFQSQVKRALTKNRMVKREDTILIAVSGGKDSLALWHVLIEAGYQTAGLHINLGIGLYSENSFQRVNKFVEKFNLKLYTYSLKEAHQMGIVEISQKSKRSPCSACGTIKRYHFNRFAMQEGYTVLATGHNLDDEAARLLGNVLRWQQEYLEKQSPVLDGVAGGFVKKIKPLYRLSEYEVAAYSFLNKIDYVIEECPMSQGAPMLVYKKALNLIENQSPGTKQQFYLTFLENQKNSDEFLSDTRLYSCITCGQPTSSASTICGYCKITSPLNIEKGPIRERVI